MTKGIVISVLLMTILSCSTFNQQNGATPAKEKTAPFSKIDFKGDDIYVTVNKKEYKWLKLDAIEVSEIVDLFKENYSNKWQQRLSEDLVEYLNKLDVYPRQKESFTIEDEEGNIIVSNLKFDSKKRDQSKDHFELIYDREIDLNQVLTRQKAIEDIDQLEHLIKTKYSYVFMNKLNIDEEILSLKEDIQEEITSYDLALKIERFINKFGDGHSRIRNVRFSKKGVLPFSVHSFNGKVICTKEGELLKKDYPFLHSINGIKLSQLLDISEEYLTSNASPQFKERKRVSRLDRIGQILEIAGSSDRQLKVVLESEDGRHTSLVQEIEEYSRKRTPVPTPFEVKHFGDIAYLRIKSMAPLSDKSTLPYSELEHSKGLVIDLRDNGGGLRDILIELAPHFINAQQGFVVGNIAQFRTDEIAINHNLSDRYLYQVADEHFDEGAKLNLNSWSSKFSKSIVLEDSLYSSDYFLYIEGHEKPKFSSTPTVVLMNEGCFSATDIFLSTLKEIDGVTLIGTPSGGGSGRSQKYTLKNSVVEIQLSSIVSFQPSGKLYDGIGVRPDIEVKQSGISDFLKQTDSQLDFALDLLRKSE
jgi:hypothetical protein